MKLTTASNQVRVYGYRGGRTAQRVLEHLQLLEGLGHQLLDAAGVAPCLATLELAELALGLPQVGRRSAAP